jgi:hypothetical protein
MRFRFALVATLMAANAFAVAPQFWRVRTADDFLSGDIEGFAVTSRGELRPGPSLEKVASFTDPFVLAQAGAPNGDHFFGTGNEGKLYRLRGSELRLLYMAPEPEIYAVVFHNGAVYAGTSPNGKVYRVDPNDGKATVFFDPKQAYIWSMLFLNNGDLAVATGVEGKLLRVTPKGEGKVWFDAPETHLRSMALRNDGSLLVGGSGKGRIYEVGDDGSAHALYDSSLSEISAIYVDARGIGWAAGVSNVLPSSAPAKPATTKPGQPAAASSAAASSGEAAKKEGETATATVEATYSFDESAGGGGASQGGNGELYKINPDGFVEVARKFEREMVYGIGAGRNGSILLATGPQGRVYEVKDGEAALVADLPEKQIVSISVDGHSTLITTTNSGAVYRIENAPPAKAEFRSVAKDLERFSKFGHYRIEGTDVGEGHVAIAFRSGNTRTPDATWSNWSAPSAAAEGGVSAPPGRYLQWKLSMPKPAADIAVENVTVGFINRNIAPIIDGVSVADPAVVFISSSYPASPQIVEATNPDEYGIFTSLDTPREKNEQGKKVYRKGYRTIAWHGHDENGDSLRYSIAFRRQGSEKWLRLRDNMEETQFNFDTSQLPDGKYELKLSVTDAQDNPEGALTATKEGLLFTVDNTPPHVSVTTTGEEVTIRVTDKLSTVGKVEYSADAQKWIRLTPVDGIADSSDETYRLPRSTVAGKFVIIRAVDAFYNVATEAVVVP